MPRALFEIHRLRHPLWLLTLAHAARGACFAAASPTQLIAAPVLIAVTANVLITLGANLFNAALDMRNDQRTTGKVALARAVIRLGQRRTLCLGAAEMTVGLGLAATASLLAGQVLIVVLAGVSVLLDLLYNLEPVRLKRRGIVNPITNGLQYVLAAGLVGYLAVRSDVDAAVMLMLGGSTVLLAGRCLWWTIPDAAGDRAAGDRTPAVRYGISRTLLLTRVTSAIGLALLVWGLWWHSGPGWALLAAATGVIAFDWLWRTRHRPEDYNRMLRSTTNVVAAWEVLVLLIPLAAGWVTGLWR